MLEHDNLQFEEGNYTPKGAYDLSKMLVVMMARGFHLNGMLPLSTTMLTIDPGLT